MSFDGETIINQMRALRELHSAEVVFKADENCAYFYNKKNGTTLWVLTSGDLLGN